MTDDPGTGEAEAQRTSYWTAALRAEEHAEPDRFLDDPYAGALTDEDAFATVTTLRQLGAPTEFVVIRGRIGDEALRHAVTTGTGQAVCLGAGSDTRAWRVGLPAGFHYFEVDLPGRSAVKARLIETGTGAQPTCHWHPVPADLQGDWPAALRAAGLRSDRPVHWFLEGLLFYLPVAVADDLIRGVSMLSVPGSTIVGDVFESSVFTHAPYKVFVERLQAMGVVLTALDDFDRWLHTLGWLSRVYRVGELATGAHPLLVDPLPARLDVAQTGICYFFGTKR